MKACSSAQYKSILQNSFHDLQQLSPENTIFGSTNGFVHSARNAYSKHHHLTLRREDIWFAILTQLGFYINADAEELRRFFISHQGKEALLVQPTANRDTTDFDQSAQSLTDLMANHLNDPGLLPWIMPDFTTTTNNDKVVASVLMMGAMEKYFSYIVRLSCGLPSVTLRCEREDYVKLITRLEKIRRLGSEAVQFATLLKPVLNSFVASFDTPSSDTVLSFWNKIVPKTGGSATPILSGWITAFCFWAFNGKSLYAPKGEAPKGIMQLEERDLRTPWCELEGRCMIGCARGMCRRGLRRCL